MRKIRQLARKWGTKLWKRHCEKYAFNGKTIAEYEDRDFRRQRSESNLLHDIAHFVVAAPERRSIPEFGLGDSPDTKVYGTSLAKGMTHSKAQDEEELASALGIYWERELGLDWQSTFIDHTWTEDVDLDDGENVIFNFQKEHKFARKLLELKKRNII
jgi:hypothetical protein